MESGEGLMAADDGEEAAHSLEDLQQAAELAQQQASELEEAHQTADLAQVAHLAAELAQQQAEAQQAGILCLQSRTLTCIMAFGTINCLCTQF